MLEREMTDTGYIDAIELQARTADYLRIPGNFERDIGGGLVARGIRRSSGGEEGLYRSTRSMILRMAVLGETYFISDEAMRLVLAGAAAMPDNWELHPESLPSEIGFCLFRAVLEPERTSTTIGFGWHGLSDTGIVVTFWSRKAERMASGRTILWRFHYPLAEIWNEAAQFDEPADAALTREWMANIAAFFEFVAERILVSTRRATPRPTQRRVGRSIDHEPVVGVVELRRREYRRGDESAAEHDARDYHCRWLVSGHWRQQWYPKLGKHQPKWISPYVKGPEDKPLKTPRAKVFAVVR